MAVPGGSPVNAGYPPRPQIRFDAISEAWRLFQQEMGTWVLATLLAFVAMVAVFAVLWMVMVGMIFGALRGGGSAAPAFGFVTFVMFIAIFAVYIAAILIITGGLYRMAIKQVRGEAIAVGDVFSVTDVLPNLLIASILVAVASGIGGLFCVIPGLVVQGLLMLAIPLVVDQRMGAVDALTASWNALKGDAVMATVFHLVVRFISGLGSIACGVGILFTLPLLPLTMAIVYRDFFLAQEAYPTPPPPPPAGEAPVAPPPAPE